MDDAYNQHNKFISLFDKVKDINLIPRPAKSIERINKKIDISRYGNSFKVNSDFMAFRVPVLNVNNILTITSIIESIVLQNNGYFFNRNDTVKDNKIVDIVNYAFCYIPSIGYIIELQIGHPIASYVFTIDSGKRDYKPEYNDVIDLWKTGGNPCTYEKIKEELLNCTPNKNTIETYLIEAYAENIPIELKSYFDI